MDVRAEFAFVAPRVLRLRIPRGGHCAGAPIGDMPACRADGYSLAREGDFGFAVRDARGRAVVRAARNALTIDGPRTMLRLHYAADERIYGLGQDPMARLDHRDQERRMWTRTDSGPMSGDNGVPMYLSSAGYGLFLNSFAPARFFVGDARPPHPPRPRADCAGVPVNPAPWPDGDRPERDPAAIAIALDEGDLDVFLLLDGGLEGQLRLYAALTGRAALLPRSALGFILSRNRYRSMDELLAVARRCRVEGVPLDYLVIDWLWFCEFGDLAWDQSAWPDPAGGIAALNALGVSVMQAQHPFFHPESLRHDELARRGLLSRVPSPGRVRPVYDFTADGAARHWWDELIAPLYRQGVRAFWTDMGEPEDDPEGAQYAAGGRTRAHNQYQTLWSRALYEGQRREDDRRPFILARALGPGIHRYGTAHWSGDVESAWAVLRDQVVQCQTVALSGQLYWCTDIGGFITRDEFSPELYIRWLGWGVFCTLFRTHGTRPDNEPWSFGPEALGAIRSIVRLRYRLLPYIYSCLWRCSRDGAPMVRAMAIDCADDEVACAQHDQYLFGPSLLVAPVVDEGARTRRLYLPAGDWYHLDTGQKYAGGRFVTVPAALREVPVMARAGSLIPTDAGEAVNARGAAADIEVLCFPGKAAEFWLYDDDGDTRACERGEYALTRLSMDAEGALRVDAPDDRHGLIPAGRRYRAVLPMPRERTPIVDCDQRADGIARAYLQFAGPLRADEAEVRPPEGFALCGLTERALGGVTVLCAEMRPEAAALPVLFEGAFVARGVEYPFRFGSGYSARYMLLGDFENTASLNTVTEYDERPDLKAYTRGTTTGAPISFERRRGAFNASGYVYCWREKLEQGPWPVSYARCVVHAPARTAAHLECSGDNALEVRLNGAAVLRREGVVLPHVADAPVALRAGENQVVVKVAQRHPKPFSGRELGFSLRFVDAAGRPLPGLTYEAR